MRQSVAELEVEYSVADRIGRRRGRQGDLRSLEYQLAIYNSRMYRSYALIGKRLISRVDRGQDD